MTGVTLLCSRSAGAQTATEHDQGCDAGGRYVSLHFRGHWDRSIRSVVVQDLGASLSSQSVAVCLQNQTETPPVSEITVSRRANDSLRIEVVDSLTHKRVTRDIEPELGKEMALGLVLAVAIDELLRATWAELDLSRLQSNSPLRVKAPPPEPEEGERDQPPRPPRYALGIAGAVNYFPRASTFYGLDAAFSVRLHRWLEVSLFAGPRFVRDGTASPLGIVRGQALSTALQLSVALYESKHLQLAPTLSGSLLYSWLRGEADDPTQSGTYKGPAISLSGGLQLRASFGSTFVAVQTELGAPLLAVEVTDGAQRVGGAIGLESSWRIGWGVVW
jgi:hypothetical protein